MRHQRHAKHTAIRKTGLATAVAASLALSAGPALAENPYEQEDDSWISINGNVYSVGDDSFVLDYGDGTITVEMDDNDRDSEAYELMAGDSVSVTGEVDDDFFSSTTIEARTVYIEGVGTMFWSSDMEDDDFDPMMDFSMINLMDDEQASLQGTVTEIDDDEFVLSTGNRAIRVEVDDLDLHPFDDDGYQRVGIGDYVKVIGEMDDDLFEGREFEAERVIKMYKG